MAGIAGPRVPAGDDRSPTGLASRPARHVRGLPVAPLPTATGAPRSRRGGLRRAVLAAGLLIGLWALFAAMAGAARAEEAPAVLGAESAASPATGDGGPDAGTPGQQDAPATAAQPAPGPDAGPADGQPVPGPDPGPVADAQPVPGPDAGPVADPQPVPGPDAGPVADPQPVPGADPGPVADVQPVPGPDAGPVADPQPETAPGLVPVPTGDTLGGVSTSSASGTGSVPGTPADGELTSCPVLLPAATTASAEPPGAAALTACSSPDHSAPLPQDALVPGAGWVSTPVVADDPCAVPATGVLGPPVADVLLESVAQFRDGTEAGLLAGRPQRSAIGTSAQDSGPGHGRVAAAGAGPSDRNSSPVPAQPLGSSPPLPPPLPPPTSPAHTGSVTCGGARSSTDEQDGDAGVDLPVMTLVASQGIEPAGPPARMDTVFTGRVLGGAEDPGFAPD